MSDRKQQILAAALKLYNDTGSATTEAIAREAGCSLRTVTLTYTAASLRDAMRDAVKRSPSVCPRMAIEGAIEHFGPAAVWGVVKCL